MVSAATVTPTPVAPAPKRPWYKPGLTTQVFLGLVVGVLLGLYAKDFSAKLDVVRDVFLALIKSMIAPLVFASVVQGVAGTGDMKKVGRIGGKALLYFEIITTIALFLGLAVVNIAKPGVGVHLAIDEAAAAAPKAPTFYDEIMHIFPVSVIDSMARNDVLQVVVFALIFGVAMIKIGAPAKPVLDFCTSLTQIMFKFAELIMVLAPYGVGAAIAITVAKQGPETLLSLLKLVLTLYVALVIFVVLVLGAVMKIAKVPIKAFFRAVREPFMIAFATANSAAALPKAFDLMERLGVPKSIVSFVLPAGYSFNLDGTTLHLAVASVFIAQAAETTIKDFHFGLDQQLIMMVTLMLTSKGAAAVPRASFVVLVAALGEFHLPQAGAALLLGVDAILDMARTSVNVLGNCLATVVVARWEGEFDDKKAEANFGDAAAAAKALPQ